MRRFPPELDRRRRRPLLERLAPVLVPLGAVVLTAVALDRLLGLAGIPGERPGQQRYVRLREHPPGTSFPVIPNAYYREAAGGFDAGRHRLRADADGWIEPSRVHAKPDLTVVFLGGSTTECLYVEEQRRFPYLVGRLLERGGRRVNSYNGGVGGNDTSHSLTALVTKALPLRPALVVFMHNVNDVAVLLHAGSYANDLPTRGPIVRETLRGACAAFARQMKNVLVPRLYVLARNAVNIARGRLGVGPDEFAGRRGRPAGAVDEAAMLAAFKANLRSLVAVCRAYGVTPVLMTEANRLTADADELVRGGMGNLPPDPGIGYARLRGIVEAFNAAIREVGRESGVTVIDLAARIPPERRLIYDVVHYTEAGSELAAGVIAEGLAPLVGEGAR